MSERSFQTGLQLRSCCSSFQRTVRHQTILSRPIWTPHTRLGHKRFSVPETGRWRQDGTCVWRWRRFALGCLWPFPLLTRALRRKSCQEPALILAPRLVGSAGRCGVKCAWVRTCDWSLATLALCHLVVRKTNFVNWPLYRSRPAAFAFTSAQVGDSRACIGILDPTAKAERVLGLSRDHKARGAAECTLK